MSPINATLWRHPILADSESEPATRFNALRARRGELRAEGRKANETLQAADRALENARAEFRHAQAVRLASDGDEEPVKKAGRVLQRAERDAAKARETAGRYSDAFDVVEGQIMALLREAHRDLVAELGESVGGDLVRAKAALAEARSLLQNAGAHALAEQIVVDESGDEQLRRLFRPTYEQINQAAQTVGQLRAQLPSDGGSAGEPYTAVTIPPEFDPDPEIHGPARARLENAA